MYIVMKLVKGGDLFQRIKKRRFLPEDTAREVVWSLFSAVRYLHARGIVHRDLKPENILCLDEADDTLVCLADFSTYFLMAACCLVVSIGLDSLVSGHNL